MPKPNKFDGMMHEFCVGHGWCGSVVDDEPCHVTDFLLETGTVSSEEFVNWLITAEGLVPQYQDLGYLRRLRAIFVKYMGDDEVDVSNME